MIQSTAPERVSIEVSPQGGKLDIDAPTPLELAALVLILAAAIVGLVLYLRRKLKP